MVQIKETAWDKTSSKDLGDKPSSHLTKEIIPYLNKIGASSILDVGCYNGRNLKFLAIQTRLKAYGVDLVGATEQIKEINRYMNLFDLKKIAFVTDYSKPLAKIIGTTNVDAALLWRVIHLLDEKDLKNIFKRVFEVLQRDGLIFISVRRTSRDVQLYKSNQTSWRGVMRGKITKEAPERLYFDSTEAIQGYIQSIFPNGYTWEKDLVPAEFSEYEPVKKQDDTKIEAPCLCVVMKKDS
jgi:cyclopropane fatty-acyl-phospholipid synthase-like methyltransferase